MTNVFIMTQGCSANRADSEMMKGLLQKAKFKLIDSLEGADVAIINSCTVKNPTESAFFKYLEDLKQNHPYTTIVVTGCLAQASPKKLAGYPLVGTNQIHNIVMVVKEAMNNNITTALQMGEMPPLDLPKVRKNPIIEIIPISRGCLSACTFCKTKHARGNLRSYTVAQIVAVAKQALQEGVKEIWLTSQDTMCYGFDIDTNLPTLLEHLVALEGNFKVRVGMGNPLHIPKIKEKLFPLFNHPKIFAFAHIPIQAASDKVLEDMRRGNTKEEFICLINELKQVCPQITLATDIIVGFPTETDKDYQETVQLVKDLEFDVINISRFWPRPKTPAAKMKQLQGHVIKERSKDLTQLFTTISQKRNNTYLEKKQKIIIDEKGKEEHQWIGRNQQYKPVIVEGNYALGQEIMVHINKTETFHLLGEEITP